MNFHRGLWKNLNNKKNERYASGLEKSINTRGKEEDFSKIFIEFN